jgi:5-formyltetrahydrofolate cyclo-ligase
VRERIEMRRELRARRASLSVADRRMAAARIAAHVADTRWLHGGRPVGMYASVGYEAPTSRLRALARSRHCPLYLPRIADHRRQQMVFTLETSATPLIPNRYGIPEPAPGKAIRAAALSIVFMPLLGFDARGTRLGSGGGYYDRLFAFRRRRTQWHRPLLVGVAYRCQQLPYIQPADHDVPLDALVSEDGVTYFSSYRGHRT